MESAFIARPKIPRAAVSAGIGKLKKPGATIRRKNVTKKTASTMSPSEPQKEGRAAGVWASDGSSNAASAEDFSAAVVGTSRCDVRGRSEPDWRFEPDGRSRADSLSSRRG